MSQEELKRKQVFVLLGPTASGKTKALSSLDEEKYEIISCDSRQVYKGLEIATASPEDSLKERLPHHLLSIISPKENFTAGYFVSLAEKAIENILERGKQPVLSGGAGFYFHALKNGMFPVETPLEAQEKVERMSRKERLELLQELDPEALLPPNTKEIARQGRIHPNDHYRVSRALEITLASLPKGKTWSLFWQEASLRKKAPSKYHFFGFWLQPSLLEEHKRVIVQRAKKMLRKGIIEEVGEVYKKYGLVPSLRSLGCKEALEVYLGQASQKDLVEKLSRAHIRYAKKQRLWLGKEKSLNPISPESFEKLEELYYKKLYTLEEEANL